MLNFQIFFVFVLHFRPTKQCFTGLVLEVFLLGTRSSVECAIEILYEKVHCLDKLRQTNKKNLKNYKILEILVLLFCPLRQHLRSMVSETYL